MSKPDLTEEQQRVLQQQHGFVKGSSYVLMSIDVFRDMMGVGSDEEMAASLQAIEEAMQDLEAGRTLSLDEAKRRLDEKHGVQS